MAEEKSGKGKERKQPGPAENTAQDGSTKQTGRRKFIQAAALGAVGLTASSLDPLKAAAKASEMLSGLGSHVSSEQEIQAPQPLRSTPAYKFDHLVVLMMENRSFDHMLGRLYNRDNPPPYDKPPRGQHFDGVDPSMSNPVAAAYDWLPRTIRVSRTKDYETPPDDKVGHQFPDVQAQIEADNALGSHMAGFIDNRVWNLGATKDKAPLSAVKAPMEGFSPTEYDATGGGPFAAASVLSTLANGFAVCDNWYSSLPGPTLVNRSFLHAGTSNNWVSNNHDWKRNLNPTVFNELGPGGWKIYNGDGNSECLTYIIHPTIKWDPSQENSIAKFREDARSGILPRYSFIEPEVIGYDDGNPPDDQHPPRDIRIGEKLIHTIYEAVREGPLWERTFMIVIYDEHGGFFDHRYPPAALPPFPDEPPGEDGFTFDRLGVRVPAVLISPLIPAGTIFHSSRPIDHTAVIKTLCNRFGLKSLTQRDANAVDLAEVLGDTVRPLSETPVTSPWVVPSSEMGSRPLKDLQRDLLTAAAKKYGVELPLLANTWEAKQFLKSLSGRGKP